MVQSITLPEECKPNNYAVLSESWREHNYDSQQSISESDDNLKPGWYRFGVGRMLEKNEMYPDFKRQNRVSKVSTSQC